MIRLPHIALILVLILSIGALAAQYDEQQVMYQQAYQYLAQRQYDQAERLFLQVLEKYPEDLNSVLQLLSIYHQTAHPDKVEAMLEQFRGIIPEMTRLENEVQVLVARGEPASAWDKSMELLRLTKFDQNKYRLIASWFERRGFYEQVLSLYEQARRQYQNPDLFMLEIANTALNYRLFDRSLNEYLRFLEKNPANLYFISNQCRLIIAEDPGLADVIRAHAQASQGTALKELYANTLLGLKRYDDVLEVFDSLPVETLQRFAEEQYAAMNDEIAYPAFQGLLTRTQDPFRRADFTFRLAQMDFRNHRYASADSLAQSVIADSLLNLPQNRYRVNAALSARRLGAELAISRRQDIGAALALYQDARNYTRNSTELQKLDLDIARLMLLSGDNAGGNALLAKVNDPSLRETRDHLFFVSALLSGATEYADSLMNEYIINWPAGKYVNDAIYLMMHVLALEGDARTEFLAAWTAHQLLDPSAPARLEALFAANKDEELLILAIEWAVRDGNTELALRLLAHPWEDSVARDYAALLRLLLSSDQETEKRLARDFLKDNPSSIFSPRFRKFLGTQQVQRPNL